MLAERALILAPTGRDATVAGDILREARITSLVCADIGALLSEIVSGAELAIVTEEGLRGVDTRGLAEWVAGQPPWSDFPFIVLTRHGGGIERKRWLLAHEKARGVSGLIDMPGRVRYSGLDAGTSL